MPRIQDKRFDLLKRRQLRLKNYDYSFQGAYFVTICTQDRQYLFGEIINNTMKLNNAGNMINKWWDKLRNKFDVIVIDKYQIMPNHLHGIINIVGAHPCVRPNRMNPYMRPNNLADTTNKIGQTHDIGQTHGSAPTVGQIIQWFKTMSTNEYIRNVKNNHWQPFNKHLWQRNYYEHIIRNDVELEKIREYIRNNPINWDNDLESIKLS